ncbi:TetR/AcrR family transcriptional regulator [Mucilaginibacter sp.]|uniref:TetR/AcrR family transcriptional regulator n=1 Tax=Mucilaginibacter sp. TaxID=1882438 RepID=UPI0035BBA631
MARTKDFDETAVLKKAIELFWHKGYSATSMQELVDGLGISRSSLYDTFGDKHTLYIKALESYRDSGSGAMCKIVSNAPSAKQAIRQLLELVIGQLSADVQRKGCFMVNAEVETGPHDEQVNSLICENDVKIEDAFYAAIKKGQDNGEIPAGKDARALARFTVNTVKGIRVSAKSTNDREFFDDVIGLSMSVFD